MAKPEPKKSDNQGRAKINGKPVKVSVEVDESKTIDMTIGGGDATETKNNE